MRAGSRLDGEVVFRPGRRHLRRIPSFELPPDILEAGLDRTRDDLVKTFTAIRQLHKEGHTEAGRFLARARNLQDQGRRIRAEIRKKGGTV